MSDQRRRRIEHTAQWIARAGLAGLFLYAGALKLGDPTSFAQDIANYRLLPVQVVPVLAVFLPVFELVVAAALLSPYGRGGAVLAASMLAVFAAGMAQAKVRGIDLECGCFGTGAASQVSWFKVAQNLALATLAVWVERSARRGTYAAPRQQPMSPKAT